MSLSPIVECVPNFSEGRDRAIIDQITAAIAEVDGVTLLDVDPGEATNRTVVTFVGEPEAVLEGAFRGIAKAAELIDMSEHQGAHPRMGATDVCPFVPVRGITMEECAELAKRLARSVSEELGIPCYLYERAATRPERRNLATIRSGEYEGLEAKLSDPEWAPDYGPAEFTEAARRSGATVIGARPFLIAYNVNLNTKNTRKAMKIAALVREKGIIRRDSRNRIVRDAEGKAVRDPGMFTHVKAIGWFIEEYDRCQVSINFTDYTVSPLHEVVDAIRQVAWKEGVVVTGSELVGLVPLEALLMAGRHYLTKQGANPGAPERQLVEVAVRSLGLSDLKPFDADQRIIERRIQTDGRLVKASLRGFVDELASGTPAPGGGSVSALCGALSTGLSAMVAQLTTGKKGYEEQGELQDANAVRAQALREGFLADVDADTAAFDGLMAALKLPKKTDEEKAARREAMQAATVDAIEVPLRVLERAMDAVECAHTASLGNANARSDAGVAALAAWTCAEGAWYNVCINLDGFADKAAAREYRARADAALESVTRGVMEITQVLREELGGDLDEEPQA